MQTTPKLSEFFATKIGDKLIVELEITKEPGENAISELMKMLNKHIEIIDGVGVAQIYFKGMSKEKLIRNIKEDTLTTIKNSIQELEELLLKE